ncbi:precorrin-2 dehydrogenase/sirohydrochlorin ferrochelatase family protein [Raineyella fluvialis]|uniref:precorrin-2 dehydrogenase n=1 Tax=Raineyella fluvialis TaxID=2662261 RepID=A0A5Q2FJX3_9ACTN|nr:NAD(P)-dependent oxidoreductase [Raineyella fluvialis]QGF24636.1 hypothetical protein Rai3103_14465 [Raineyella fluvialis]
MFPLALDLAGRRVVAVGGGPVSARRVRDFLAAGADVHVVSPELCPELEAMLGDLTWHPHRYRDGDLTGAWLVHTATGDPLADARVAAAAAESRIWCVNAGRAHRGTAAVPARATVETHAGRVTVAVTSGDPRRSMAVRDWLVGRLPLARFGLLPRPRRGSLRKSA